MNQKAPIVIERTADARQQAEAQVRAGWQRYRVSNRDRAEAVIETGEALTRLKAECQHGTWGPMLDTIGIPHRTAQDWMKLSKNATVAVLEQHGVRKTLDALRIDGGRGLGRLLEAQAEIRRLREQVTGLEAEHRALKAVNLRLRREYKRRCQEYDRLTA